MHSYELEVFTRLFAAKFPRDQSHKGRVFVPVFHCSHGQGCWSLLKRPQAPPWGVAPALAGYTPSPAPLRMQRRRAVWMARVGGLGAASLRSTGREGRLCAQACPTSRLGRTTKGGLWDAPGPVRCVQIRVRLRCTSAVLASSSYSRCCPTSWNAISCSSTAPLFPDPTTQLPAPSWRRPF